MNRTLKKADGTEFPLLKSTQPIMLHDLNDLFSYVNMWKSICKRGILYHDIYTFNTQFPVNEEKLKEDEKFILHRKKHTKCDFELHEAERLFVKELKTKNQSTYLSYLDLNRRLTQQLLHMSEEKVDNTSLINRYFDEINLHAKTYPEAKAYFDLLDKHKLAQKSDIHRFRRYKLYQKQEFVIAALQILILQTDLFKDEESDLFDQFSMLLLKDEDLDYDSLNAIATTPELVLSGRSTPMLKSTEKKDHKKEYDELQKELKTLDKELQKKALQIKSDTTEAAREKRFGEIDQLKAQRDMLSYVAEQHYKKSELVYKAEISAKKWVSNNLFDKKKAGKDAAKVFFCSVGASVGKAFLYSITNQSHKIDSTKLQKDIINGLIETGFTAVGTYFFGPLGGAFTSKMMPFFRDEPADPYMEEFSAIRKQMTDGFKEINVKLDLIDQNMTKQLNAVVKKLESHTDLAIRKGNFTTKKDELIRSLKKIESAYYQIFLSKDTYTNEDELGNLDKKIQEELIELISIFYHERFDLMHDLDNPSANSVCGLFMKYNREASVSFHETSRNLLDICYDLESIGQLYLDLREKWYASLAVSMLVFKGGVKTDTNKMLHIYWNAFRRGADLSASLTVELESMKLQILGAGNIELLKNIERTLDSKSAGIDFLAGFGLETVIEKAGDVARDYDYQFDDDFSGKGKFIARPKESFTNRYVVTGYHTESQAKSYYTMYTHQKNQIPVPIQVHLRLLKKDTIGIFNYGNDQDLSAHLMDPADSTCFSGSLESFFKATKSIVTKESLYQRWSLPVKDHYLEVQSVYPHAEVQLLIYHQSNNGLNTIGKYSYPVNYTTSFQEENTIPAFQLELNAVVNAEHASLELVIKRKADMKQGKVSIVLSDYAAIKKAGLSRGPEGISTYCLKMPVMENGKIVETTVRTENLRPFASNLMLAGDQFDFKSEERNHFGEVVRGKTGWRSLNNNYELQAKNQKTAWCVQLCITRDNHYQGSVFSDYGYTNKYSGKFIFQADGNFVMYDSKDVAIAALRTDGNKDFIKYAYLNNDGLLVVVNKVSKEVKTFKSVSPETSVEQPSIGRSSNRLYVEESMLLGHSHRIESENEEYYVAFIEEEIDSGHWYEANSFEFSLQLRKKGSDQSNKILCSKRISRGDVFPNKYVMMQDDGNLVGYQRKRTSVKFNTYQREVLFASNTHSSEYAGCILCVTNDGKVFLAKPEEKKILKWLVK